MSIFNHVGLCVGDTERSRRFYEGLLGFVYSDELRAHDDLPNELVEQLLGLKDANLTATYLVRDGLVLELLEYARSGNPPPRERPWNEPGLTHLSLCVDDLEATLAAVAEFGGRVLDTGVAGVAWMIADPDGQIIELLPPSFRQQIPSSRKP